MVFKDDSQYEAVKDAVWVQDSGLCLRMSQYGELLSIEIHEFYPSESLLATMRCHDNGVFSFTQTKTEFNSPSRLRLMSKVLELASRIGDSTYTYFKIYWAERDRINSQEV